MNSPIHFTAAQHRQRLRNLKDVTAAVGACVRRHTIYNYLPGQIAYNMGEYPIKFSMAPSEDDRQRLHELAAGGAQVLHIHEEWSDPLRKLGATKHTCHDPEGFKAFIAMAHSLGLKVTVYASTGYFPIRDPDFQPHWTSYGHHLADLYCVYAQCSPASPEWRAYVLPRLERIMDEYGVDGLYNDLGYEPLWYYQFMPCLPYPPDYPYRANPFPFGDPSLHVSPGPETAEIHSAMEDMLQMVYAMVHRRGGIYRVHAGGNRGLPWKSKCYDYLWVGEGQRDIDRSREEIRNHEPYVISAFDLSVTNIDHDDDIFLHSIPFMQFPIRQDGRVFTGERATLEGVDYPGLPENPTGTTRHCRRVFRYYQEHPDAYPCYGYWDAAPGRPQARERWLYHLKLYRPMVTDGTRAWIDIQQCAWFQHKPTRDMVATLFVNAETHLVLANYGRAPAPMALAGLWQDRETDRQGHVWTVAPRDLLFLQRVVAAPGSAPTP